MTIFNQIKENLEKRRSLNPEDDYGLASSWEKLTNILSINEEETINYLTHCSKEEILLISSVFDDVTEKTQSKKFISCLRSLDNKYPGLNLTFFIDDAESFLSE